MASAPSHHSSAPQPTSPPISITNHSDPRDRLPAHDALKAYSPPQTKRLLSPQIMMTGAAAAKENARHQQELTAQNNIALTTPNPAATPFGAPALPTSKPSDAPTTMNQSSNTLPAYLNGLGDNPHSKTSSPQPLQPPPPQTTQSNMFASPPAQKPQDAEMTRETPEQSRKRPLSPSSDQSRSYSTYPPLSSGQTGVSRTASLPNSASRVGRSPAQRKHKCPHCATEFTRHHNLKSHLLTHSQEKPYGCDTCDARFRRLHDLKRHLKLHTGERPHVCEICGRAFARGDALARHNKGPGGCAGRRESGVDEDDLEGLDGELDGEEDGDKGEDAPRRKSEPHHKRSRRSSNRMSIGSTTHDTHGSTYPPVAPMAGSSQAYYPDRNPRRMSPPRHFSSVQYGQHPSTYTHGVTESPKPLSPGQPDGHPRPDAPAPGRSPSISTRLQQQQVFRNSVSGTPPGYGPPHQSLPSMQTEPRYAAGPRLPPPLSTHGIGTQSGPPSGGPRSASSHHASSGGSMRELYGQAPHPTHEAYGNNEELMAYIRRLQDQNQEERMGRAAEREEIARLRDELDLLRAQIAQVQTGLRR